MGFYLDRENYLKGLAAADADIMHNEPVSNTDPTLRYSFFRINDLEELTAAARTKIHFPCMVWFTLDGKDTNKAGSFKQINRNVILFLDKIIIDSNTPNKGSAISQSFDKTFEVMQRIKKKIYDDAEEDSCDGPFVRMYPARWEQDGPIGDGFYGWILEFEDETKAFV